MNDTYNAEGTLYKVGDAEQVTERFRKRNFVIELGGGGRYPQHVEFQLAGDRCELLDGYNVGEDVHIVFRLRGREWTSRSGDVRYFNSLDVLELRKRHDGMGADDPFGQQPGTGYGPPGGFGAPPQRVAGDPGPESMEPPAEVAEDDIPF